MCSSSKLKFLSQTRALNEAFSAFKSLLEPERLEFELYFELESSIFELEHITSENQAIFISAVIVL